MRTSILLIALVLILASCGGGGGTQHPAPIVNPPDDQASILDVNATVSYDNYATVDGVEYKDADATFTNASNVSMRFNWGYVEHKASGGTLTVGILVPLELAPHETKTIGVNTFRADSEVVIYIGARIF